MRRWDLSVATVARGTAGPSAPGSGSRATPQRRKTDAHGRLLGQGDAELRPALAAILLSLLTAAAGAPSGLASHADGAFDQNVAFRWGAERQFDVVIVPPLHGQLLNGNGLLNGGSSAETNPFSNSYTSAILQAIEGWKRAMDIFGSPNVTGVEFTPHVLTTGLPVEALIDPEIIVVPVETSGSIGGTGGLRVTDSTCFVTVSESFVLSYTFEDMYNVFSHVFGRCLGLGSVGNDHPAHDVMDSTYEHPIGTPGTHSHCVSNLNVKGLEVVFDPAPNNASKVSMPVGAYLTAPC